MQDNKQAWQNHVVDAAGYSIATIDQVNAVISALELIREIEIGTQDIFGDVETVETARSSAAKIIKAQIEQLQKIVKALGKKRIDESESDDIGWDAKQSI